MLNLVLSTLLSLKTPLLWVRLAWCVKITYSSERKVLAAEGSQWFLLALSTALVLQHVRAMNAVTDVQINMSFRLMSGSCASTDISDCPSTLMSVRHDCFTD